MRDTSRSDQVQDSDQQYSKRGKLSHATSGPAIFQLPHKHLESRYHLSLDNPPPEQGQQLLQLNTLTQAHPFVVARMPLSTTCSRAIVSAKAAFSVMGQGVRRRPDQRDIPSLCKRLIAATLWSRAEVDGGERAPAASVHRRRDYRSKGLVTESEMQTFEQQAFKCA